MVKKRRSVVGLALATIAALVAVAAASASDEAGLRTYRVTIANLTGGQPLTPPIIATHRKPLHVFEVGAPASFELKEIAENGNLAPMLAALGASGHVFDVEAGGAPIVPASNPGGTPFASWATFTLESDEGAKYFSWASMLICTNDGFTGVDSLRLPQHVGDVVSVETNGYDAGTEINTEDFADIVPPCPPLTGVPSADPGTGTSNPLLAEGGVIHHHPGIQGGVDLIPALHGWTDPVAMVEIERLS